MIGIAVALAMGLALSASELETPGQITAVSGHGRLTAGIDADGVLSVLRWPDPGGPDQILQDIRNSDGSLAESMDGGAWGVEVEGRWHWMGDTAARSRQEQASPTRATIVTTIEWPEDGLTMVQRAGVSSGRNVFLSAVDINTSKSITRLMWVVALAPSTCQLPEIAVGDRAEDSANGFAAFVDRAARRVWSFRPKNPGRAEWKRARELIKTHSPPGAWDEFDDGTWLGLAASADLSRMGLVSSAELFAEGIDRPETQNDATVGPSYIVAEFAPKASTWIAVGVGVNRSEAGRALDGAAADASVLLSKAPAVAEPLPPIIQSLDSGRVPQAARHWAVLQALRDPKSAFTVRSLSVDPPLARDWPRDGAIAAWALFEAGEHEAAWKSIEAYLSLIRTEEKPRRPFGSMPESVYTNGELASPHFVIDDRGPARVLWVAERLLQSLAPEARATWVKKHWKPIEAAAEFLSTWADARRGAPLYCADPVGLADVETQDRLFADFAGMSAAIRLAESAGRVVPDTWRVRREQLLGLTEWVLKEPGRWVPGGSILLETNGITDPVLKLLADSVSRKLATQIGQSDMVRLLLQASILKGHATEPDSTSLEAALSRVDTAEVAPTPDSAVSSEILLAILLRQGK